MMGEDMSEEMNDFLLNMSAGNGLPVSEYEFSDLTPEELAKLNDQDQSADLFAITPYDSQFAARQLIENGKIPVSNMQAAIPDGTPNLFVPSSTIPEGYKYQFDLGEDPAEFKWHAPDSNVLKKFGSSSNFGTMWTAQIKVNDLLLGLDGNFYDVQKGNLTHIPLGLR
ncbi:MAG: hypothetical protein P4L50_20125 [Anaerolineaceae bacterium]|nr:hypothetical protein [Anaerolineaceae bacterium]